MLTKDFRLLRWRELFNFSQIIFGFRLMVLFFGRLFLGDDVFCRVGIAETMLVLWDDCLIEIFRGVHIKKSSIPIICNSTTIGYLWNQIPDSIPRRSLDYGWLIACNWTLSLLDLFSIFHIKLQDLICSVPIWVIEVVDDIPSQSFKPLSFDDERVVPAQAVKNSSIRSPVCWIGACVELFGHVGIQTEHICFHSLRWLSCDLDASLKNRDGEFGMRVGGEPQSEFVVNVVFVHLECLQHLLKIFQKSKRKMAVCQIKPRTVLCAFIDFVLSLFGLALTEGNWNQLNSLYLWECFKLGIWIHTRW